VNKHLIHSIFEDKARKNGSKVAIEYEGSQVSYEALNRHANRIANCLLQQQLGRGQVVGAFFKCNPAYVASIIGINKAGGAFMPLEIDFPLKRFISLLDYAQPGIIITGKEYLSLLTAQLQDRSLTYAPSCIVSVAIVNNELQIELFSAKGEALQAEGTLNDGDPAVELNGDDSNYIFYTSGSTGNPKQIEGCHKGLSHFIHWEIKEFSVTDQCKVSQLAPVSFDVSLRDIFVPLVSGGTLCIPGHDTRFQPASLLAWLIASQVTLMHCVPTVLRLLTDELKSNPADAKALTANLRHILLAGEALFGKDVLNWWAAAGRDTELVNIYGPSETTLAKMFHRVPSRFLDSSSIIPLGKAISNTVVLILKDNRLCEIGEPGEIHIKTPFRTKGYYKNEALTKERFIQNPLNENEDIIYKTGDLGKYNEDMDVLFMGREDSQVKISGNRIEMQEIENALAGYEGMKRAVVKAYAKNEGEDSLACYYTSNKDLDEKEIRSYLRDFLPEYMLPSVYIRLDEFPLNRNGKIDRGALPEPAVTGADAYEAPMNELEAKLENIFKEVLALPAVGRRESFFNIGLSSLKGIKIIARIFKTCNIIIRLPDLFSHPTIAELSDFLAGSTKKSFEDIKPLPAGQPYYEVTHAQRRLWILSQFQEENQAYNIFYAYTMEGRLDRSAFSRALMEMVNRHESLRTVFVTVDGEPRQRLLAPSELGTILEEIDISAEAGQDAIVSELGRSSVNTSFDLAAGPLIKAQLGKLADDKFVFFLVIHHIISDGWSMNVFVVELLKLYDAYSHGHAPDLKPLKFQYKDFAAWQNKLLSGKELAEHRDYWLRRFAGDLPLLEIPSDKTRPAVKTYNGNIAFTRIPDNVSEQLKGIARKNEATLFMILMASVNTLFHKYSGQEDIIIGIPIAGREHADLDNQIGLFVNTLAIRTPVRASDAFTALLTRQKELMLGAYKYQAYPFDRLVDNLELVRDISRSVLFDVMVVLHDTRQAQVKEMPVLKDISVNGLKTERKITKFDLSFNFAESDGGIKLQLEYNTDLFSTGRIQDIMDHYLELVASIAANEEACVGDLNFIPSDEQALLTGPAINAITGLHATAPEALQQLVKRGKLQLDGGFRVMDASLGLVPQGSRGELFIWTNNAQQAEGYNNTPDPYQPGRLLINTGAIAEMEKNEVKYIGRKEAERKFKGLRINLDQVAHQIKKFPGIVNAAVELFADGLTACIYSEDHIETTELSDYLNLHLSSYMVPVNYIISESDEIPADAAAWNAIAKKAREEKSRNREFTAPRNKVEQQLSDMLQQVMNQEQQVSVKENLFLAGFHSLKAMRLITSIYKEMGVKINLVKVFSNPTIEALAAIIAQSKAEDHETIQPLAPAQYYKASHEQAGLWMVQQMDDEPVAYNIVDNYLIKGSLDVLALEKAFLALIKKHESLRTAFKWMDGRLMQEVMSPENISFEIEQADLRNDEHKTEHARKLAKARGNTVFNLEKAPLLKLSLIRTQDDEYVFVIVLHHIITDEWSMQILFKELLELYGAYSNNQEPQIIHQPIQYKEYANWQHQQLEGPHFERHKNYWLTEMSGELPVLELPLDNARPALKTYNGQVLATLIGKDLSSQLQNLAASRQSSLFMMMFASFSVFLNRLTGQDDMVIGTPLTGREHPAFEEQIGFFLNTLPIRARITPGSTFTEVLDQAKQKVLNTFEHQAYPFDLLVEQLAVKRDLSRAFLFDVLLVVQERKGESEPKPIDGLEVQSYKSDFRISKFDLTFNFINTPDGIIFQIEYNTDLFEKNSIFLMQQQFVKMLERICQQPDKPVMELSLDPFADEQVGLKELSFDFE
jgi:amino acid adenylation domain-containing protein